MIAIFQLATLTAFMVFISDFRKKPGMTPLVSERVTRLVKLSHLVPIGIYGYVLATLERALLSDWKGIGGEFFRYLETII